MIYLFISILISSLLFVIFKLFSVFKINTSHAIVINYAIAIPFGIYASTINLPITQVPQQPWFLGAFCLGFLFIAIFNIMGLTAQKNGLSVASVSGKMSVVIPISTGIFLYNESINVIKITGILIALIAVYLSSAKSDTSPVKFKNLIYPLLLFIGSGIIDAGLKYMEIFYVSTKYVPMFLATIFGVAFIFGCIFILLQIIKNNFKFHWKNCVAGVILGVPNYYSMEFLLKALQTKGLESSTLFTINNVSVVVLTTTFALFFFKEKLVKKNFIGIGLAIISILLVAWA
ncbi:EamA/RhaT family transporter [Tenacibaculum aestuariivivum]|uniref:EamA/RhaT family transporter n=1 Tax=Tenacibaculum aestuariivivum TaxID=2006131 RepID=UPI003AB1824D